MRKTIYPDWVEQFRSSRHAIKKVGNNYYLYERTSKRVQGKKNPQPDYTYVGVITPNGLDKTNRQKVNVQGCVVKEFGYTQAMLMLCPESWKKNNKVESEDLLKTIIVKRSPESYLTLDFTPKVEEDFVCSYSAQCTTFNRRFYQEYGINIQGLDILKSIYVVYMNNVNVISTINEEQQNLLDKLELVLAL